MNICGWFIQRKVATTLLMLSVLLWGIVAYRTLPVSDLPNVDFPTIMVSGSLPGASPETMASAVATPLERQLSAIPGLASMTSISNLGSTQITLQFSLTTDINAAASDVQAAISAAQGQLPDDMPNPPSYRKVNPADSPILYLAVSAPLLPLSTVDKYAETLLAQRISAISGVAQVNVYGSQKYAVRIQLDPDLLAARDLGMDEVIQAIKQNNVNLPTGSINGKTQTFLIQSDGQLTDAAAYKQLIVAYRNGAPIRLKDLGTIIDSVENNRVASWYQGKRTIVLAIQRQPGSNTVAIVADIKAMLPQFEQSLPVGMRINVVFDRAGSIKAAIHEVNLTLIIASILVVLVIMVFLQSVKLALIPAISLPLSLMATFGMMAMLNFSLNNLSLLGLSLAVGFVVDDAIVMLENIAREKERGLTPMDAAVVGAQQITFTIIAMTLSLIVVFAPLLFMQGLMGRLFHEFSVTVSIAILSSGVIALTFIPMLASRWLSAKPTAHDTDSLIWFNKLTQHYQQSLGWMLARPRLGLGLFFTSLALSVLLFIAIPKGFLPTEDTGQLLGFVEGDTSTSFAAMAAKQNAAVAIIAAQPGVIGVMSSVGAGGASGGSNTGRIIAKLAPLSERPRAEAMLAALRPKLSHIPGLTVYLQLPPSLRIGGRPSKSLYQFTLQYGDLTTLTKIATQVQREMQTLPTLQDVTSDWQFTGPQIEVQIDRERAATLGISAQQIEQTLASAFATQQVSTIYTELDAYEVIVELLPNAELDPNALRALYLRASTGKLVPLTAVAHLGFSQGPVSISHQQQLPAITLSFNVKPGYALSQAMSEINSLKDKLRLPPDLQLNFQGNAQAFADSMSSAGIVLILSLLAIYVLLGMLYESYIHPLTILSGLPSAAVGGLITLWLLGFELDLYGFIGIILLLGIVKKNAIMMIDFANTARQNGAAAEDAIYQACIRRFRPIMMTTFAALIGALPIALAIGAGAESRRPLGLVVVGGLLVSQWLTLYLTPIIYLYLDKWQKR